MNVYIVMDYSDDYAEPTIAGVYADHEAAEITLRAHGYKYVDEEYWSRDSGDGWPQGAVIEEHEVSD